MMSKDITFYIQGLNAETGKQQYETKLEDAKYESQVFKGYSDEEKGATRLIGLYFEKGSKIKDASLGFWTFSLNEKGQIVDKKFISWAKDVARLLPVNEKGKLENVGYFFIHNMVSTKDGRVYVISENYKKSLDAGATIFNVLAAAGGGHSNTSSFKVVVTDMAIFELTSEFDLKSVKFIDKEKTNVFLPAGAGYMGVQMLGFMAKAYGGFDYSFTQTTKGDDGFIIGYQDYEKVKGEKNGWTFSGVANVDDEYTSDKIDLRTESSALRVLPAKPGYVLVIELKIEKKREKSISMRLEKINY